MKKSLTEGEDVSSEQVEISQSDFSIKTYLKLREDFPDRKISPSRVSHFNLLFILDEQLKEFGIDGSMLAGILDGSIEAIDTVCLNLLRLLDKERQGITDGETHLQSRGLAPSGSTYGVIVCMCLEALEERGDRPTIPSLNFLIQQLLLPGKPSHIKTLEAKNLRYNTLFAAAHFLEKGKTPSLRSIARILGVAPSTISRMFPDNSFIAQAEHYRVVLETMRASRKDRDQG
jgi:hypothetical protein